MIVANTRNTSARICEEQTQRLWCHLRIPAAGEREKRSQVERKILVQEPVDSKTLYAAR